MDPRQEGPPLTLEGGEEPVWSFRGYRLEPGNFTNAMVHLFRAQVTRADTWRLRLDSTTNWAVVTAGLAVSMAFGTAETSHTVIIICTLLVTLFLWIEARRYRYYELWSARVRLLETDFFAPMLVAPFRPGPDWAESLAHSLLQPEFPISLWEALGRRLRYNYIWMYVVLGLSWIIHVAAYPTPVESFSEAVARAAIGGVPGEVVLALGLLFNGALCVIGLMTIPLTEATGEVLRERQVKEEPDKPWYRPTIPPLDRFVALIVTDEGESLARGIKAEMRRSVTALHAGLEDEEDESPVLVCAVTAPEMATLKSLVHQLDPTAFVMTLPAFDTLSFEEEDR